MKTGITKNKGIKIFVGVVLFCSFVAKNSALASTSVSPYAQVAQEILAILEDPTVAQRLSENGSQAIVSINRYDNLYKVATSNCVIDVNVIHVSAPIAPDYPVPEAIQLEVGYPVCLPGGISVGNR